MSSHTIVFSVSQAVRCWFLAMKAWVQLQGSFCRSFGGQSSTGAGISLGILFPPASLHYPYSFFTYSEEYSRKSNSSFTSTISYLVQQFGSILSDKHVLCFMCMFKKISRNWKEDCFSFECPHICHISHISCSCFFFP